MTFLSDYALDVMRALFNARVITIPIHPSLHTKIHPNFVQVADDISRELVRFNRIEKGAVRLSYSADNGTLTLFISNTKPYEALSEEEDDPDRLFTGRTISIKPWKTQEECLNRTSYPLLLAFFRTMCLKVIENYGHRVFYFPRSHFFLGRRSLEENLLEMPGLLDTEEYSVHVDAPEDNPEWFVFTFHLK